MFPCCTVSIVCGGWGLEESPIHDSDTITVIMH